MDGSAFLPRTGLIPVDRDHASLMLAIASFVRHAVGARRASPPPSNAELGADFCRLLAQHCRDEELLMLRAGYPAAAKHQAIHQEIRACCSAMLGDTRSTRAAMLARSLIGMLHDHVQEADLAFAAWCRATGALKDPSRSGRMPKREGHPEQNYHPEAASPALDGFEPDPALVPIRRRRIEMIDLRN